MTSQRQTDANRRNALVSTGPRTETGKQRSRCNAYRHGLTAQTVVTGIEDAAEYVKFEAEILAEYDPKSTIERELTLRLASLLWRLRRANLIETGLLLNDWKGSQHNGLHAGALPTTRRDMRRKMTSNFLHLGEMMRDPLDRVTRYEIALWRQFVQVLFSLDQAKFHRIAASRGRFTPHPPQW